MRLTARAPPVLPTIHLARLTSVRPAIYSARVGFGGQLHLEASSGFQAPPSPCHSGRTTLRLRTLGGLWIDGLDAGADGGPRPRRLALLAILAAAGAQGASRERVLGVLWPESEPEKGRHALSQTLYALRRDLGADVVVATHDLRIDVQQLSIDVEEFRTAIAARDFKLAASLYAGPFLDGFYLADAPEFERWIDAERATLARDGIRAIEASAREASSEGRSEESAAEWRRLGRLDPLNSRFAASYMEALVAIGDRPGAVAHGSAHTELLRRELDADPDATFQRLVARLRDQHRAPPLAFEPAAPRTPSVAAADARQVPNEQRVSQLVPRFTPHVAVLVAVAALGFAAWRAFPTLDTRPGPVLAVGQIRDLVAPDSAQLGGVLSEMLATSLGRLTDLQVIANSRILELTPRSADTARTARTDAARRAGATEILEGELIPLPDRQLRLAIRRVDINRGLVRRGYQLTSSDRVALFDSVTVLIAGDLRVAVPTGSLAEVSTRSPIAYRLYEDGLRAFFQFDSRAAYRLFRASIKEDSTFAMATYYAWRSAIAFDGAGQDSLADRAVALASRASPRDRLQIMTHVGAARSDVRAEAAAESLAVLFPNDPEALLRAATVIRSLPRAISLLDKSIALDSAAAGPMSVCRLCDALNQLAERFLWADSLAGVEQTLNRWKTLRPLDHAPQVFLAHFLVGIGRRAEAEVAFKRAIELGAQAGDPYERQLLWSLRSDDVVAADKVCSTALATADRTDFSRFRWYCTIALRMQGRFREALALIHEGRAPGSGVRHRGLPPDRVHAAILDMEMGRPLSAANQFEALGRTYGASHPPGVRARGTAWNLTLAATAATEGNDTLRARALVDSIESSGSRSLYGRDPLLHLFVRGLLKARAQQHDAAVRDLRAAVYSPSYGYTRVSYELGRSLLALHRPAEAIVVLRAPLHGGIDGAGLYLTRAEVHELLAQAFDANRQADSAAAHYAIVERAWRGADPILATRYAAAKERLARGGKLAAR